MTLWSAGLRDELCTRAASYAKQSGVTAYQSRGDAPVTLFPPAMDGTSHGNFAPSAYSAIVSNTEWRARLEKAHSRKKGLPAPHDETARELDSCTSSDALLMNVFCYPGLVSGAVAELLGVAQGTLPEFGVPGEVPLAGGTTDRTEVDMRLGDTNVEAKLTESDFTSKSLDRVEQYRDFETTFEKGLLQRTGDAYDNYQLIRNVLAVAAMPSRRFVVILDARRPDLLRAWWETHSAIRDAGLRARCGFVLWQELAAKAPLQLREFLAAKYGL
jgi:hypothetical protein